MELVRKDPATPTYHAYDEAKLYERGFSVYSQFGKWLSAATTTEEIQNIYTALGAQRRKEGFALSELLQALIITRRVLWTKIESEGLPSGYSSRPELGVAAPQPGDAVLRPRHAVRCSGVRVPVLMARRISCSIKR